MGVPEDDICIENAFRGPSLGSINPSGSVQILQIGQEFPIPCRYGELEMSLTSLLVQVSGWLCNHIHMHVIYAHIPVHTHKCI